MTRLAPPAQVETGSAITWKYPSVILKGDHSVGEFYSVALTNNCQQADTGTKMVHVGAHTRSRIVSKGISAGRSNNAYRGLVQVRPPCLPLAGRPMNDAYLGWCRCFFTALSFFECSGLGAPRPHCACTNQRVCVPGSKCSQVLPSAQGARNYSQCDSMLIGDQAGANTYPYIQVRTNGRPTGWCRPGGGELWVGGGDDPHTVAAAAAVAAARCSRAQRSAGSGRPAGWMVGLGLRSAPGGCGAANSTCLPAAGSCQDLPPPSLPLPPRPPAHAPARPPTHPPSHRCATRLRAWSTRRRPARLARTSSSTSSSVGWTWRTRSA